MSTTAHARHRSTFALAPFVRRSPTRSLVLRMLRGAGTTVGLTLVFVISLAVGTLVHLNTPAGQRLVIAELNGILAPTFEGKVAIRRLGHIGLLGLSGTDATVDDPSGHRVISARDLRVGIATIAALRSALLDEANPLTVDLSGVAIDSVEVSLDTDAEGQLELVNAFALRAPSTPSVPPGSRARGFRLAISRITIRHGWAQGQIPGLPSVDVDVDDLRGALTVSPDALDMDIDGVRIAARRLVNRADVAGSLQGHLEMPLDSSRRLAVRVAWDGTVGGIAQSVRGSFAGDAIDAVIDVPSATPEGIRSLWPDSPVDRAARLHLEAHGPLARVVVALHAALGKATLEADGQLALRAEQTGQINVHAREVDVHELAASAPPTRLGLDAEISGDVKPDGTVSGNVAMRALAGSVGTASTPPASLHADASMSHDALLRASAEVFVDEPGAPTWLTLHLAPKGQSSSVDFHLASSVADLQKVPRLAHGVGGHAGLSATGQIDITKKTIDARLDAQAASIAHGTTQVETLSARVSAHGPLEAPQVDAVVSSRGLVVGGWCFASADVTARGAATSPHLTASLRGPDTADIDAGADLELEGGVSLRSLRMDMTRGVDRSRVTARSIAVGGGGIQIDEARIEGLGAPLTATASMTDASMRLRVATTGIDLARIARLAHLEKRLQAGTVAIDTDLHLWRGGGEGRLALDVAHVSAGTAKDVSAHADVALAGRTAVAKVHAEAAGVGVLDLTTPNLSLSGAGALASASWKEVAGSLDLDLRADLAGLAALVPPDDLPVNEARGEVRLEAHVARDDIGDLTPDVDVHIVTDKLVLAPRVPPVHDIDGVVVHRAPAWRLSGIDFDVVGKVNGHSGAVSTGAQARDESGILARLDGSSEHFPFADIFHETGRLMTDLQSMAIRLNLAIPEREFGSLPPMLRQHYVTGHVRGNVAMTGTMRTPVMSLDADLSCGLAGSVILTPLDVNVAARYDGRRATGSVKARSRDKEVLDLETQLDAVAAEFLDATGTTPPWVGSARAHLASFPLESVAALDDKQVAGRLSGDVALQGLHEDAHIDADVSVDGLSMGSVAYDSARLQLKVDGKGVDGRLRIDQTDGFAEAKAHAAVSWGAEPAPTLARLPLDATFAAKNLRIAVLMPFVSGFVDELDGRLDGNTSIELDPHERTARLNGTMTLSRGTVEAAAGGGELHDITANVQFSPDGTITLQKLTAAGLNGRLEAVGSAHLQGTTLQSAHAAITIPGNAAIPLAVGGVELGQVDGRIDVTASTAPGSRTKLMVDVPSLEVKLTESSTGSPQSLGAMPGNVRIGAHRGDPARFVLLPLDPGPKTETSTNTSKPGAGLAITTHLADVHLIRGTQLRIDLEGSLEANVGNRTKVTGQIRLKRGGLLDVEGRAFTIESGTVTFVDDPGNPEVVVKASWTAADGTVVYATFTGPLETGKVTLTSQPQLPKNEIVQLLLFGRADGTQAQAPSNSTQNTAIATAGGEAAQPLNHMLGELGLGAISAKIDTSQSANPKPEVEVQIARDISLQMAVVLGQPPPGVNPDHTLVTLDWRFLSMWSLATTVGDAGTTIFDLLWQRRY